MRRWVLGLVACGILLVQGQVSRAQGHSGEVSNEANNPLTPKITLNLHDYYVPKIVGLPDRGANQLLFRGLIPAELFGVKQLIRYTLPLATSPAFPRGSDTGLGDLTLMDIILFPGKAVSFGVGPLLVAPTAGKDALGAGKWQAGGAAVAVAPQSWGMLGGLVTYQHSFAGDDERDRTSLLTVQPLAFYNLPHGLYLRSSAIWSFDLIHETHYVPVGFGVGKVWLLGHGATLNTFVEPQYTVFRKGEGMPRWQIFGGINFQFSL